jgi:hypothetical protein
LEWKTRIGDFAKLGRDCEIHQRNHPIYTFIICYIRMIVFVEIIPILRIYNALLFSHLLPDVLVMFGMTIRISIPWHIEIFRYWWVLPRHHTTTHTCTNRNPCPHLREQTGVWILQGHIGARVRVRQAGLSASSPRMA